jgi:hypothetical protein
MARSTSPDSLPDFMTSPDLGELAVLAFRAASAEQSGNEHPAAPVLARAYTRAAAQLAAFHARDES